MMNFVILVNNNGGTNLLLLNAHDECADDVKMSRLELRNEVVEGLEACIPDLSR